MMGGNWARECVAVCLGVTIMKGLESKLCKDENENVKMIDKAKLGSMHLSSCWRKKKQQLTYK